MSYIFNVSSDKITIWASIGLTVTPLPVGSGTQYKSKVSLGYLSQSFQNAVMEGVRYGMEQGLYGSLIQRAGISPLKITSSFSSTTDSITAQYFGASL